MSVRYQFGANSQLRSFGTHHTLSVFYMSLNPMRSTILVKFQVFTLWETLRQTPPKWLMEWYHVVTALSTWNCKLSNGCPAWCGWAWEIVPGWRFGSPTCNASRSKTRSWQRRHQCRPWEIAATQSGKDTATYTGRSRHASCVTWKPNGTQSRGRGNQLGWLAREDLLCHCLHLQVSCLLHGLHIAEASASTTLRRAWLRNTNSENILEPQPGSLLAYWQWTTRSLRKRGGYRIARYLGRDPDGRNLWLQSGNQTVRVSHDQFRDVFGYEDYVPTPEDVAALKHAENNIRNDIWQDERLPKEVPVPPVLDGELDPEFADLPYMEIPHAVQHEKDSREEVA